MAIDINALNSAATSTYQTVTGFSLDLVAQWWAAVFQTIFGGMLLSAYQLRWWLILAAVVSMIMIPVFSSFSFFGMMRVGRYKG